MSIFTSTAPFSGNILVTVVTVFFAFEANASSCKCSFAETVSTTIIAISQHPKDKLVNTTHGLRATERGLLIVDENNMTTREGVFAAGDVVHGSLTVVHAVEEAKNAAAGMIAYMEEEK